MEFLIIKERYYIYYYLIKEKVFNTAIDRNVKNKKLLQNNKRKPREDMSGAAARTGKLT